MAGSIRPVSVAAPGFLGLNTQESGAQMDVKWATEATNCVIDENGRIASRKGWATVNSSAISGTPAVRAIHEYLDKAGTSIIVSAAGNKIYSGTTSLTDITGSISVTNDNWQFRNFNGKVVGIQSGVQLVVWSGTGNFATVTAASGTLPQGDACLAAFGRVWAVQSATDKTVLKYSALLDETHWSTGAGSINVSSAWANGMDEIVALEEFNGRLVIFGKNNILIYANAWDVANMVLEDSIIGIGCMARDSVVNVGTDILFLSSSGVRTLSRTVQEPSMPVTDVSRHVKDYMMTLAFSETARNIKACYSEREGFYLLSLPSARVFCFDMRYKNEDKSLKCTTWTNINPTALCVLRNQTLYMGQAGYIGKYYGYLDNASNYTMLYKTAWFDMGEQVSDLFKIPKKLTLTLFNIGNKVVTYYIAYDFIESDSTQSVTITSAGSPSEWAIAEYGIGEYSGGTTFAQYHTYPTGHGKVIRLGFSVPVDGDKFSLQKLDFLTKLGRIN